MEGSSITGGPFPRGDLPKTGLDLGADGHEANFDWLPVGGYAGFRIGIGARPAFRHVTNVTRFLIAEILL